MTGAHKLTKDDIVQIRELFKQGFNNSQISRMYTPIKGNKVTREHISGIRRDKRWNFNTHSFFAKENLPLDSTITTVLGEDCYETEIGYVITKHANYHVFLRYKNGTFLDDTETPLVTEKPLTDEILKYHNQWIFDEISKI